MRVTIGKRSVQVLLDRLDNQLGAKERARWWKTEALRARHQVNELQRARTEDTGRLEALGGKLAKAGVEVATLRADNQRLEALTTGSEGVEVANLRASVSELQKEEHARHLANLRGVAKRIEDALALPDHGAQMTCLRRVAHDIYKDIGRGATADRMEAGGRYKIVGGDPGVTGVRHPHADMPWVSMPPGSEES